MHNLRIWSTATPRKILTQVTVGENEGIESALRRFKRQVSKSGIFADLKRLSLHFFKDRNNIVLKYDINDTNIFIKDILP